MVFFFNHNVLPSIRSFSDSFTVFVNVMQSFLKLITGGYLVKHFDSKGNRGHPVHGLQRHSE